MTQSITCQKIGDSPFSPFNCYFGRCNNCPKPLPNRGEDIYDDENDEDKVNWVQHKLVTRCSFHGIVEHKDKEELTKCPKCAKLSLEEQADIDKCEVTRKIEKVELGDFGPSSDE